MIKKRITYIILFIAVAFGLWALGKNLGGIRSPLYWLIVPSLGILCGKRIVALVFYEEEDGC